MRYAELLIDGKSIKSQSQIDSLLKSNKFYWLIDSEIEMAQIEIKNNTLTLDEILDKINEFGINSLSLEEQKQLEIYSKK